LTDERFDVDEELLEDIQTADKNFVFEIEYTTEFEKKDICVNYEI